MQRLLQSPQGVFAMRRLDQDEAGRIETENVEAMTVKPAKFAHLIAGHDEDYLSPPPLWGREGWGVARRRGSVDAFTEPPDPHPQPLPTRGRGTKAGKDRHHEAEGGRCGALFRHDLMQAAAGQTTLREMGIEGGKTEGKSCG
jgi:hypothetical protein